MKKMLLLLTVCLAFFAGDVQARTRYNRVNAEAIRAVFVQPEARKDLTRKNVFKDPSPKAQVGVDNLEKYKPKFKSNEFRPHYVYYTDMGCWLNITVCPAVTNAGANLILYYAANKEFTVHFASKEECTAALNILLNGEDVQLPPYYVTKGMVE